MILRITTHDENCSPPWEGTCERIGKASLLASIAPASPMRLGGSLALPIFTGFSFFTA